MLYQRTNAESPAVGTIWNPGMMSSIRTDWATPRQLFEMLHHEFDFVLDVCATAQTALCGRWIHKGEDALSQNWETLSLGGSIWMNPPYGRKVGHWIEKALRESATSTVVCLLPARTDTSWFHDYCLKGEVRFLRGRLYFDDNHSPGSRAPFPSMLVIFRARDSSIPRSGIR